MSTSAKYKREFPQRYRLEAGRCIKCGKVHFPPRLICARCGAREFETIALPDQGAIETYTIIRVPPSQFVDQAPYAIAIIKLDNGVRLTCQVTDCAPEDLDIGKPVKLEFRAVQQEGEAGVIVYGYKAVLQA